MNGVSNLMKSKIAKKFNNKCFYCGTILEIRWHADHKIPKSMGGKTSYANLVPACITCNMSKHNLTIEKWYEHIKKVIHYDPNSIPEDLGAN